MNLRCIPYTLHMQCCVFKADDFLHVTSFQFKTFIRFIYHRYCFPFKLHCLDRVRFTVVCIFKVWARWNEFLAKWKVFTRLDSLYSIMHLYVWCVHCALCIAMWCFLCEEESVNAARSLFLKFYSMCSSVCEVSNLKCSS